ncbi:hypothetical protein [Bacillus nitratireducens]|uniref:hypothetical protein n=1 Tax=Bacillus nitratireducens TaxID=2026193 RepID=UPI000A27BAEF|nr:hypothetical protein [Bacillus nitratireducens]OSX94464.1 hypothetical protein BTJ45_01821 [Bacillus mycoides]PFJ46110.1 hypothetical protein COI99_26020 [Bacillus cereus]
MNTNFNPVSIKPLTKRRRMAATIGLFFLSPFVAEYLLGNISISAIATLPFLALMYGCGSILIREITRRRGYGWPTMILMGLAYGILEEGLITQSLFNPSYANANLLSNAPIPELGISAWWTLFVLTLHTVWSTSVPIALIESFIPNRKTTPWLGKLGIVITCMLFVAGMIFTFYGSYAQEHFLATPVQFISTLIAILVVIIIAFRIGHIPRTFVKGDAPNPWVIGVVSLISSSLFMIIRDYNAWGAIVFWLLLFAMMTILFLNWSRRKSWGNKHELALAGGALLTYAWHSFIEDPVIGATGTVDLIGNVIFSLGAIIILFLAIKNLMRFK